MNTPQTPAPHSAYVAWMANTPELHSLRIDELILPGSHNSAADKTSPNLSLPQEISQDISPLEQLRQGVRVLDLRVALHRQYAEDDPRRFQLFHLTSTGRTVEVDIIGAVKQYLEELRQENSVAREIIILDFHQFKNFTDAAHEQLQRQVIAALAERVLPYSLHPLTLGQLWRDHPGKNVVIAYNRGLSGHILWDGINQRWPGNDLFNTNTLKGFIDSVAEERKPYGRLTAVQCAKYSLPFYTPTDLSVQIDRWFRSVDMTSYIQKFRIINTDWTLRSEIVANCRHASGVRALYKSRFPDTPL